jgi:hypothetical protein
VTRPTIIVAFAGGIAALGAIAWLVQRPILLHRLHGHWRSYGPIPTLSLQLDADGSCRWGPERERYGNIEPCHWRLIGRDELEISDDATGHKVREPITMSSHRDLSLTLRFAGIEYLR